jgi:hypothetical protein
MMSRVASCSHRRDHFLQQSGGDEDDPEDTDSQVHLRMAVTP